MCHSYVWLSVVYIFIFFFFKQKTAYEMRISDWSSDVCSSDLHQVHQTNGGEGRSVAADLRVVAHHGLEQIAGVADHAVEHFLHGGLAAAVEPQHAVAVALDHEDAETAQRSVRLGEEGKVAAGEKVAQRLRTGDVAVGPEGAAAASDHRQGLDRQSTRLNS